MGEEIKLTQMSKACGCAAKIGPGTLAEVLSTLPKFQDENLLVGIDTSDDAAVYKVSDDTAIIQTTDFFTPIVNDPYTYGQVAATNALSDVYAMGGEPKVALNLVGFPTSLDISILGDILKGGASKVQEAGAVLVGGHSIMNDVPIYGLAVTGFVHPDKIRKNFGAQAGDVLILTKQIGCGIVNTAVRGEMCGDDSRKEAELVMTTLNKKAKEVMDAFTVHACTDVTGFGLAGHATEMAKPSGVTLDIDVSKIPFIDGAKDLANMGLIPAGAYRNRKYTQDTTDWGGLEEVYMDLCCDPQTSGGLLFAVPAQEEAAVMKAFADADMATKVAVIGYADEKSDSCLRFHM